MPKPAIGGKRGVLGETTTEQGDSAKTLGTGAGAPAVPHKVTLTIEFGTLAPELIAVIGTFVQDALQIGPSAAVAVASDRGIAETAVTATEAQGGGAGGAAGGGAGGAGGAQG